MSTSSSTVPSADALVLTAREFAALTEPVAPHAGGADDPGGPILSRILIRTAGGHVTALATDRYVAAMKRVQPASRPTDGLSLLLPATAAARIRSQFRARRHDDPVLTFTSDGESVTVTAAGTLPGLVSAASLTFATPDFGSYPLGVDRIIRDALTNRPEGPLPSAAFAAEHLARFRKGASFAIEQVRLTATGGARQPYLVEIGDDFVAAMIPARHTSETPTERQPIVDSWLPLLPGPIAEAAR